MGQIHSPAMLLRESFGRMREAQLIEAAVEHVWEAGIRTDDLAEPGARMVGTTELTDCIVQALRELAAGVF